MRYKDDRIWQIYIKTTIWKACVYFSTLISIPTELQKSLEAPRVAI